MNPNSGEGRRSKIFSIEDAVLWKELGNESRKPPTSQAKMCFAIVAHDLCTRGQLEGREYQNAILLTEHEKREISRCVSRAATPARAEGARSVPEYAAAGV
jgi:hypothetical protein